jgi:hypothetical protein
VKQQVQELCRLEYSMNDVERMARNGFIGEALFRAYKAVWEWSAPRMGGMIGLKHDAFWERYGKGRYYDKINKVRKAFGFELIVPWTDPKEGQRQ